MKLRNEKLRKGAPRMVNTQNEAMYLNGFELAHVKSRKDLNLNCFSVQPVFFRFYGISKRSQIHTAFCKCR
jgi:hypothetical protein